MLKYPTTLFAVLVLLGLPRIGLAGAYEDILIAARENRSDVIVDLVQRGMDPNTSDPAGSTLLMYAAANGNEQVLDFLLTNHANILKQNKYGDTAIGIAALNGRLSIVRQLIDAGARADGPGWGAIHYAAFNGHGEIVRFLLTKGTNPDAPAPNRQTPLMLAAHNGFPDVVKILLDAGADRNHSDGEGNTAIGIALRAGNNDIAGDIRTAGAAR